MLRRVKLRNVRISLTLAKTMLQLLSTLEVKPTQLFTTELTCAFIKNKVKITTGTVVSSTYIS